MIFARNSKSVIRRLETPSSAPPRLFLTFDDGPDAQSTPQVLRLLHQYKAKATFFVVAQRAAQRRGLLHEILSEGHAYGDHSLDHRYGVFLGRTPHLESWVLESESRLTELCGQAPVGFRPPAGVCTPPLIDILHRHKIPLVLWRHRFFDTVFSLRPARTQASLDQTQSGDIVLLHDRQSPARLPNFLEVLGRYLEYAREKNLALDALTRTELISGRQSRGVG